VRELIIDVDEQRYRLAWAALGKPLTHYNASAQLFPLAGGRTRFVWIADLLPNDVAPAIGQLIDQVPAAIRHTFALTPPVSA